MKTVYGVLMLFLPVFLWGCGQQKLEGLEKEVMAIHDEAMLKMGTMKKLEREISSKLGTLEESADSEKIKIGEAIQEALSEAEEGMMQWMRNYTTDEITSDEEKRAYLEKEKKSIQKVESAINKSISDAESFLETL